MHRHRNHTRPAHTEESYDTNVLGTELEVCCAENKTGFFRDGACRTDQRDAGSHVVCAVVTKAFLAFSRSRGNDLVTPVPEYGFPGLKPGDRWCLCASRWRQAYNAGVAPQVHLAATHQHALNYVPLEALTSHATKPA